jgi:tRNA(adenine34) deaminase
MVAMRAAARAIGNYRLVECELFVTLEPCAMCAGAMIHARLQRLICGASDPKTGAAGSVLEVVNHPRLNHQMLVTGGVLSEECGELLREFFRQRRT